MTEHVVSRVNDGYYVCDVCGDAGSERWAINHQFPSVTAAPPKPCMVCDLYAVIDRQGDTASDFVAELVTVLPPRGHGFHKLGIWEESYRSPEFLRARAAAGFEVVRWPGDEVIARFPADEVGPLDEYRGQ